MIYLICLLQHLAQSMYLKKCVWGELKVKEKIQNCGVLKRHSRARINCIARSLRPDTSAMRPVYMIKNNHNSKKRQRKCKETAS